MNSEDIKLVTELIEKKDSDQLKEVIMTCIRPTSPNCAMSWTQKMPASSTCCWTTKRQPTY